MAGLSVGPKPHPWLQAPRASPPYGAQAPAFAHTWAELGRLGAVLVGPAEPLPPASLLVGRPVPGAWSHVGSSSQPRAHHSGRWLWDWEFCVPRILGVRLVPTVPGTFLLGLSGWHRLLAPCTTSPRPLKAMPRTGVVCQQDIQFQWLLRGPRMPPGLQLSLTRMRGLSGPPWLSRQHPTPVRHTWDPQQAEEHRAPDPASENWGGCCGPHRGSTWPYSPSCRPGRGCPPGPYPQVRKQELHPQVPSPQVPNEGLSGLEGGGWAYVQ